VDADKFDEGVNSIFTQLLYWYQDYYNVSILSGGAKQGGESAGGSGSYGGGYEYSYDYSYDNSYNAGNRAVSAARFPPSLPSS
jgi:hypothetical protein